MNFQTQQRKAKKTILKEWTKKTLDGIMAKLHSKKQKLKEGQ